MKAREVLIHRLEAASRRSPDGSLGVAPGVWLDDIDAVEREVREPLQEEIARLERELQRCQEGHLG